MPPLPKTCLKTVCPRKVVAFLWKAFLQKNFQVREKIPLSALVFGCCHAHCAEGFNAPAARRIGVSQEPGGAAGSTMAAFAKTGAGVSVNRTCRLRSERFKSVPRTWWRFHCNLNVR
jgi:hypothetical protein